MHAPAPSPYAKYWAALAQMNLALQRHTHAALFPRTMTIGDTMLLRAMLNHIYLWQLEGRLATVSRLARATGASRATCGRKLAQLIEHGYVQRVGRTYVTVAAMEPEQQRCVLERLAAIVRDTAQKLANLAAEGGAPPPPHP